MVASNTRPLVVAAFLVAVAACAKPTPEPPNTLDSPRDMALVRWCVTDFGLTVRRWSEECEDPPEFDEDQAYSLVANSGNRFAHRIRVDSRPADYVDYDRAIPGNTGVQVPDGPTEIETLGHPTIALVASERDAALSVIEFAAGTRVPISYRPSGADEALDAGPTLPLDEPLGAMRSVLVPAVAATDEDDESSPFGCDDDCTAVVVGAEPAAARLVSWTVDATCGGSRDEWTNGCTPAVEIAEGDTIALPGSPIDIAVRSDGRVWVSMRGERSLALVGLFGDALEDECGGEPCVIARLPVGPSCSDGVDDDGDGLIDADDPQCFGPNDSEAGTLVSGPIEAPSDCTDGTDDDGDGLVDADDPDCIDAADRIEGPGYDGALALVITDGDGLELTAVPSQAEVVPPGEPGAIAACANGEDDDGDGLVDEADPGCHWENDDSEEQVCSNGVDDDGDGMADLDDPGCYGPNDESESDPALPFVSSLGLTEEGDILAAVDRRSGQLFLYRADGDDMIAVNDLDPTHDTPGTVLFGSFLGPLVTDSTESVVELSEPAANGTDHITVLQRRVHVATTSGYAETVIIDEEWFGYVGDPDEGGELSEGPFLSPRYEPRDRNGRLANIDGVACSIPGSTDDFVDVLPVRCSAPTLPQPAVVGTVEGVCEGGALVADDEGNIRAYDEVDGDCYGTLRSTTRYAIAVAGEDGNPPATGIETLDDAPDDYGIAGGGWEVVWQGTLNGSVRDDTLVDDETAGTERGWLRFAGTDPCEGPSPRVCSDGLFDRDECPELWDLCRTPPDGLGGSEYVCGREADTDEGARLDIDVCDLCPTACRSSVDLCALGALPGDILELERWDLPDDVEGCSEWETLASTVDAEAFPRLEFEVCSVTESAVEVATFEAGCAGPVDAPFDAVQTLPPSRCVQGPLESQLRARDWLLRIDQRAGPSPYRAVEGRCVFAADGAEYTMRPVLGRRFESPLGLTFELAEPESADPGGYDPWTTFPREFELTFDVDRELTFRSSQSRELLLGPATSAIAVSDTDRGRRIAFIDESQSFLWLFSAFNYGSVDVPLP